MKPTPVLHQQRGITLVELMVVIVIVGILASVAYPSYVQHIVDTKRTAATSVLLQVADRQQQFFMDNKRFANDLTQLGFPANPLVVGDDGQSVPAGDVDSTYSIALANVGVATYTATATPLGGQATRDTDCGALSIDQSLTKGHAGPEDDCWQ